MNQNQNKTLSFEELLSFVWRKRKPMMIVAVISIVISSIFSGPQFIKPKYKSTLVFYPTTTNSISRSLLPEMGQRAQDALEFGAEEEAEKALQILQSSRLRNRLVEKFDLLNHYNIDVNNDKYPYTRLEKKLDANIKVSRTRYLSIKIDVLDQVPEMAADLANGIASLYDTIKNEIKYERALSALQIVERAYNNKQEMIHGLHAQMQELGRKGVVNYEEQTKSLQEALILARGGAVGQQSGGRANPKVVEELLEQQNKLIEFGGLYLSIVDKIKLEEEKLSDIKAKLDRARIDVEEQMTHRFVVSEASAAEKKAYPVRWLIVLISLASSLLITALVFALLEKVKSV